MFYRHNKTFWYQFCNFKHFLKAENSEDSLDSLCVEFSTGLLCNSTTGYFWVINVALYGWKCDPAYLCSYTELSAFVVKEFL